MELNESLVVALRINVRVQVIGIVERPLAVFPKLQPALPCLHSFAPTLLGSAESTALEWIGMACKLWVRFAA